MAFPYYSWKEKGYKMLKVALSKIPHKSHIIIIKQ